MRDVLTELTRWWRDGQPVGMATVVGTWRSAPRPAGATMLVGAGRHRRRQRLRRLRRGRRLRAVPRGDRDRRTRCCSGTASATTTRSRSG